MLSGSTVSNNKNRHWEIHLYNLERSPSCQRNIASDGSCLPPRPRSLLLQLGPLICLCSWLGAIRQAASHHLFSRYEKSSCPVIALWPRCGTNDKNSDFLLYVLPSELYEPSAKHDVCGHVLDGRPLASITILTCCLPLCLCNSGRCLNPYPPQLTSRLEAMFSWILRVHSKCSLPLVAAWALSPSRTFISECSVPSPGNNPIFHSHS